MRVRWPDALRDEGGPRRPTSERTYGYYRAEILAALVNGATLVAIAVFIFVEAYERSEILLTFRAVSCWPSPLAVSR